MDIAIYKPYKKIFWNDWSNDTNVWSREIVNFSKLLADNGHKVYLVSDTDYNNECDNVCQTHLTNLPKVDVFVVFNGNFSKNVMNEGQIIDIARRKSKKILLVGSDLRLFLEEHNSKFYDKVLTATKDKITVNSVYGAIQDYHMYKEEMYDGGWEIRQHRGIFIGHDRHKEEKFLDYVWRPNVDFFGKFSLLNVNKKIQRDKAYDLLKEYTYSIVFFDDVVNNYKFVTARPHEVILFGAIPFIDVDYDQDCLQFEKDSWLRVKDYKEFYEKAINLNKNKFLELQQQLQFKIKDLLNCKTAYDLFMDATQ